MKSYSSGSEDRCPNCRKIQTSSSSTHYSCSCGHRWPINSTVQVPSSPQGLTLQIRPQSDFRALPERGRPNSQSADFQYFEEKTTRSIWIGKSSNQAISFPKARHPLYQAYYEEYKEWLGWAMYRFFGIPVPELCLSFQIPRKVDKPVEGFNYRDPHLHVMSRFIDSFSPLGADFLEAYKQNASQKKPPQVPLSDGLFLPLQGFGTILAVACFLYDSDCLGGGGSNMGYLVEERGEKIARIFKIDPGCAFSFLEQYEEAEYRHDPRRRDIRFSPQRLSVISYHQLSPSDQQEFVVMARRILQTPNSVFKNLVNQVICSEGFTAKQAAALLTGLVERKSTFLTAFAPEVQEKLSQEIRQSKEEYLKEFLERDKKSLSLAQETFEKSWHPILASKLELSQARVNAQLKDNPNVWHFQLPSLVPDFLERGDIVSRIRQTLHQGTSSVSIAGIQGLGGAGKTQLATDYVNRSIKGQFGNPYQVVIWLDASSLLNEQFQMLADSWCKKPRLPPIQAVKALYKWLQDKRTLIVFDNIENKDQLSPFLPADYQGKLLQFKANYRLLHILFTTRQAGWEGISVFPLGEFSENQAEDYVKKQLLMAQKPHITALLEVVTLLPLPLAHATAYIKNGYCSLEDYPHHFASHQLSLAKGSDVSGFENTVMTTFLISASQLEKRYPGTLFLLQAVAFLSPNPIPLSVFEVLWQSKEYSSQQFQPAMKALLSHALVQGELETGLTMHRLVQAVLQRSISSSAEKIELLKQTAECVICSYPMEGDSHKIELIRRMFISHLKILHGYYQTYLLSEEDAFDMLLFLQGSFYARCGEFSQAEPFFEKLLSVGQKKSPYSSTLAGVMSDLGFMYVERGHKIQEGLLLMQEALRIHEQEKDSPFLLVSALTSLGQAHFILGNWATAESFLERSLDIQTNTKIEFSESLLIVALSGLGEIYVQLNKTTESASLLKGMLTIRAQIEQKDPDSLQMINISVSLGQIYVSLGRIQEAQDSLNRALSLLELHQHSSSTIFVTTLIQLGLIYLELEQYPEALSFLEKALTMAKKSQNLVHESSILNCLGLTYMGLQDYLKSQSYLNSALSILESRSTFLPLKLEAVLSSLGMVYIGLGKPVESISFLERGLKILQEQPVEMPLQKGITLTYLGTALMMIEDFNRSISLLEEAMGILRKISSTPRSKLILSIALVSTGSVYVALSELKKGLVLLEEGRDIFRQQKNVSKQLEMTWLLPNLGRAYVALAQMSKGCRLLERALFYQDQQPNPSNLQLLVTLVALGQGYLTLEKLPEARSHLERALNLQEELPTPLPLQSAMIFTSLGGVYVVSNEVSKGLLLLERSARLQKSLIHSSLSLQISTFLFLGQAQLMLENLDKARRLLEKSLALQEQLPTPSPPLLAVNLLFLGILYADMNGISHGMPFLSRGLNILKTHPDYGRDHPVTQRFLNALKEMDLSEEELEAAQPREQPIDIFVREIRRLIPPEKQKDSQFIEDSERLFFGNLIIKFSDALNEHFSKSPQVLHSIPFCIEKILLSISQEEDIEKVFSSYGLQESISQEVLDFVQVYIMNDPSMWGLLNEKKLVSALLKDLREGRLQELLKKPAQAYTLPTKSAAKILISESKQQISLAPPAATSAPARRSSTPSKPTPPAKKNQPALASSSHQNPQLALGQAVIELVEATEIYLKTLPGSWDPNAAASFVGGVISALGKGEQSYRDLISNPVNYSIPPKVATFIVNYIENKKRILLNLLGNKDFAFYLKKYLYKGKLQEMGSRYEVRLRKETARWVPDSEASNCQLCDSSFGFFNRRHHCRECGKVVCNTCSTGRIKIARPLNKQNIHYEPSFLAPVRVCSVCHTKYKSIGCE